MIRILLVIGELLEHSSVLFYVGATDKLPEPLLTNLDKVFESPLLKEDKIISKTFLGSTIRYKIGTNKTKNGILIVDKSSNDSEVFNLGDYVKIDFLQKWKIEL